jgi:hypothetical protein
MHLNEDSIEGTLKPDGTLQLDRKPSLPPGRVRVAVQATPTPAPRQRGLADVIDEIRQGQVARGFHGRSADEIDAARREGEDEYEQRMQALHDQPKRGPV